MEWEYDRVGNRVLYVKHETGEQISYQYNDANQLLQEVSSVSGVTTYAYDPNGWPPPLGHPCVWQRHAVGSAHIDPTARPMSRIFPPRRRTLGWSKHLCAARTDPVQTLARMRLIGYNIKGERLIGLSGGGRTDAKYRYDALGRRIIRYTAVNGNRIAERYFYDGADVIADYDMDSGNLLAQYVTLFLDENLLKVDFAGHDAFGGGKGGGDDVFIHEYCDWNREEWVMDSRRFKEVCSRVHAVFEWRKEFRKSRLYKGTH